MSKPSLRVYFIKHHDGRRSGILMRPFSGLFDKPPPAAYGDDEEQVLARIEGQLQELLAENGDLGRYLWTERFEAGTVTVNLHPQSTVKKRPVIGKKRVPLRLTYVASKVPSGGFRVLLPRFDWWLSLEDLSVVSEVVTQAIGSALLGAESTDLYDFREEGEETVREWLPRSLLGEKGEGDDEEDERSPVLEAVAEELVEKAARGKLPTTLGTAGTTDLDRLIALVFSDPRPSILLVGEPGVGKTSLVRRLAKHLSTQRKGRAKQERAVPRIFATSGDAILSGMVYLGMWQERCLALVDELQFTGDYLYLDRLLSVATPQRDGASIADILLPAMVAAELSVLAECSEAEVAHLRRKHPQLLACFRILRIEELGGTALPALLAAYHERKCPEERIAGTSTSRKVFELPPTSQQRLLQHLAMYQPDSRFPGKALRFLDWLYDELAPRERLAAPGEIPGPVVVPTRAKIVTARDISRLYSRRTGLPFDLIAGESITPVGTLAEGLRSQVIGQPAACEVAAQVLARFKAGMNDPERPLGALLFVGPTGVGKTELAKALTRTMFGDEKRMIRLDMSEYMHPGSAARLLDARASADTLLARIRRQPLSLVLFDEIEKAHPEVFDLLLGVLGEGRLTDQEGRLADFRMALICLTSNLGVSETATVGFGARTGLSVDTKVRQHFRAEFVNRLDAIVPFRGLDERDVRRIVDLELGKAGRREGMLTRRLTLSVSEAARARLATLGFHPTRGARPLRRVIEERLMTPLSVRLAEDPSLRGRVVQVLAASELEGATTTIDGAIVLGV
jgi:ATP-dependent Clp protease ATP-binding subunit ClpC